ncbi:phage tail tape measure protein [Rhizobium grahamii]|uniref:Phage tail protein n=1 Tax=Rhizobium grahamii CCGE 502 TaxID=990285 RepID=S3HAU6_9HYPH|nr:phage tail tape measure protein [Rhizobium grahamii]EPE95709.1 phage tail protein [Rhizobium grahamii CCGE 502]
MASAVIGALRVNLGIDSAEFQDGLKKAQASLAGAGKSMQSVGKNMSTYLTAPIAALGALTIKSAGDFEAAMNRVGAASGATSEQLSTLQKMALDLGANTSKSASEAADAMEMLAKNGVSVEDIIGGAAAASIKLSEATGGDLSSAADVATNVMAQFKLEVTDLGKVVDGITGVTLQSQFGFEDYKNALAQAGGVAGSLGVSIEEFNAAIAATSSVFNSGSDAGTSFKSFLTTLTPKSKEAAAAMQELGLEFFNADGSMKSMSAIAEELKGSLSGLSDEAKINALKDIFGVDAMRTAIALADQGAAGIDKMSEAVSKQGSANEQSAARMKGFNGEMEKLSGALETLAINIANSGLLKFATDLVSGLAGIVDSLSKANPELLKWGAVIAGLTAVLGPIVLTVGLFVTGIAAISSPVLAAVAAITAIGVALVALYQGLQIAWPYIQQFAGDVWAKITTGVESAKEAFIGFKDRVVQIGADIIAAFVALPGKMIEIGGQIIDGLWQGIQARWEGVKANIAGIGDSIATSIKETLGIHSPSRVMHEVGTNVMEGLNNGITNFSGTVVNTATGVASSVTGAFSKMESIGQTLSSSLSSAFKGVIDGSKTVKEALSDVLGSLADMALNSAFQAIFGGGGIAGSSGGIFGSLFGGIGKLFGFASGGSFQVGGAGGIDSQLVAFKASPNETVSVTKPGQERAGGELHVTVGVSADNNGNLLPFVQSVSRDTVAKAAPNIVSQANQRVVPTMAQYQTQKAGGDYRTS